MVDTLSNVQTAKDLPDHLQIRTGADIATRGEKFTHTFAHKIVNFLMNYLLSITITDLHLGAEKRDDDRPTSYLAHLAKGTFLETTVAKMANGLKHGVHALKTFTYTTLMRGKKEEMAKDEGVKGKVAEIISDVFTLMLGGHLTATIATMIQNRTHKWARRFDKMFDSFSSEKPTEEVLAQREERYKYLEEQPKISGWTTLKARGVGFLANLFTGSVTAALHGYAMHPERYKQAKERDEKLGVRMITQTLGQKVVEPFFHGVSSAFLDPHNDVYKPETEAYKNSMRAKRFSFWSEMLLFEGVCTLNTSMAHWLLTGGKHGKHDKKDSTKHSPAAANPTSTISTASNRSDVKDNPATHPEKKDHDCLIHDSGKHAPDDSKKNWVNERVTEKGEVKPHEERRQEQQLNAHAVA